MDTNQTVHQDNPTVEAAIVHNVPEPPVISDRPYPEYFATRQGWHQRQRNQETLIAKPIKSRYFEGFEKALDDADLYTVERTLEDLAELPSTKSKIKVLQRRQKQLTAAIEQVQLSGSSWQGILTPDQLQGIHLTFVSPSGSRWLHHITDSESIWVVADYFYEMVRQHFGNDEPVFVGSRDQDIKVHLRQPAVAQSSHKVQEGDRVRLYGDCLPDTLEWFGDAGLKGEVGEAIVFTSGVGDGIYRGKTGIIAEVHDRNNFTATFAGTIDGYPGDSFTIPVERGSIARRLKYRELSEGTVFDIVQIHGLGIELSYEGAEFRVNSSAIREVLEVPEPNEATPVATVLEEVKPLEIPKTFTGIQAGDRVKVISSIPAYQQYVGQVLEVVEVTTPRVALLHLGDGRTGAFPISEFIKVDDAIVPDNSDPVIIENPAETIITDGDGRVVIQPEFRVGASVVADFSQHNQKTPPQGLQGIRDGQAGKIIKVKVHHNQYLEYSVLFEGLAKERAVPSRFVALAKEAIALPDSTDRTVLEQVETMNDEQSPSIHTPASQSPNQKQVVKLRDAADKMEQEIDQKLNPAISNQRVTQRRAAIADNMAQDGRRLKKIQTALRAIAQEIEAGTCPAALMGISGKGQVADLIVQSQLNRCCATLQKIISTQEIFQTAKQQLAELLSRHEVSEDPVVAQIKALERGLLGYKIPGYFPTPRPAGELAIKQLDLRPGLTALEPQGGKGDLAILLREAGIEPDVIEINPTLVKILELKGFKVVGNDFLLYSGQRYDRILMNPPFGQGGTMEDADHVRHAYENVLAPGGIMASIMSPAVFHRTTQKAKDFRDWFFNSVGGDEPTPLPDGSFQSSDRPTGVSTVLVTLRKPLAHDKPSNVSHDKSAHRASRPHIADVVADAAFRSPFDQELQRGSILYRVAQAPSLGETLVFLSCDSLNLSPVAIRLETGVPGCIVRDCSEAKMTLQILGLHAPEAIVQMINPVVTALETSATSLGVVVHVKHSEYDQYIGRANPRHKLAKSKWHNPYQVGRDGDLPTVLRRFESHLVGNQSLMEALEELRGKRIACWCCDPEEILTADDPLKCHGQILLRRLRGDYAEQSKTVLEHLETMKEFRFEPMRNSQKVLQGCLF